MQKQTAVPPATSNFAGDGTRSLPADRMASSGSVALFMAENWLS